MSKKPVHSDPENMQQGNFNLQTNSLFYSISAVSTVRQMRSLILCILIHLKVRLAGIFLVPGASKERKEYFAYILENNTELHVHLVSVEYSKSW